ncbi:aminotransferase class V-fold PLP-dependent enzyme [Marinimicrococcus flavescens]|uniref:Aminotransferase class V-fold PLP-dependent enzyme n=1 Tax=Marinimicrococcus flavescens TaxID=3031815 RepID=A0AAP4D5S3_9PROT|nr:aminotransferase class V-fold PLP-dependent enzyme [Marinimicrococcus flavescens]
MRKTIPENGTGWPELEPQLERFAAESIDWRHGRSPLFVFLATESAYEVGKNAFFKFFSENALGGKRAFQGLKRMEDDVLEMALSLFSAPPDAAGNMSTGGSESIFLAVKAARERFRALKPGMRHDLNMVVPHSAHPAFDKAGQAMDIEVRRVPVRADLRADVKAMADRIDERTFLLAGSAPCFPHGLIDPIDELSALAIDSGLWLHVDACVGGYVAPFVRRAGYSLPEFDFALPGVRSISADLHKFGFCPKPASTVFYREREDYERQIFDFDDWPSGRFTTPMLSGTRAGGAVAAAWAVFHHLGAEGYCAIARDLMEMTRRYVDGIEAIEGLQMWAQPDLTLINFGAPDLDIFAVAEGMRTRGWLPGLTQRPRGMHMMMSLVHEEAREAYLGDLRAAVEAARAGRASGAAMKATY